MQYETSARIHEPYKCAIRARAHSPASKHISTCISESSSMGNLSITS